MAYPKLKELRTDITIRLGLVPGTSVQTYAEPQIDAAIFDTFEFLWGKAKWKHLWTWHKFTLNGVDGTTTEDWVDITQTHGITRWEDVAEVRINNARGRSVPWAVADEYNFVTGSEPLYRTPMMWDDPKLATKVVRFYPLDAVGTIAVFAGHRPTEFSDPDGIIPFDRNLMILGSVWKVFSGDGLNANAAGGAQAVFDSAFTDYLSNTAATEIGHGAGYRDGSTVLISPN